MKKLDPATTEWVVILTLAAASAFFIFMSFFR